MTDEQMTRWRENMAGGRKGRRKKSEASVRMSSAVHTYIMVMLSQKSISQTLAARICGCSVQFMNMIIRGARRSWEVQDRFATLVLGLHSWEELEWRALAFQEEVAKSCASIPAGQQDVM